MVRFFGTFLWWQGLKNNGLPVCGRPFPFRDSNNPANWKDKYNGAFAGKTGKLRAAQTMETCCVSNKISRNKRKYVVFYSFRPEKCPIVGIFSLDILCLMVYNNKLQGCVITPTIRNKYIEVSL